MSAPFNMQRGETFRGCTVGGPYEPDSPEWGVERRSYVGASEVASILWRDGDWHMWARKVGLLRPWGGNSATRRGHAMEPWIVDEYARSRAEVGYPVDVITVPRALHIAGYPVAVNLDALDLAADLVVEAKSSTWRRRKEFQTLRDEGPTALPRTKMSVAAYWVQVQMQVEAIDAASGMLVVELGDGDLWHIPVARDREFARAALDIVAQWWERHVVAGVAPQIRTPVESADLRDVYPVALDVLDVDDDALSAAVAGYSEAMATKNAAEKRAKALRAVAESRMRELGCISALVGKRKLGYSKPRTKLDTRALRLERPEIAAQYTTTAEHGSFAIK